MPEDVRSMELGVIAHVPARPRLYAANKVDLVPALVADVGAVVGWTVARPQAGLTDMMLSSLSTQSREAQDIHDTRQGTPRRALRRKSRWPTCRRFWLRRREHPDGLQRQRVDDSGLTAIGQSGEWQDAREL